MTREIMRAQVRLDLDDASALLAMHEHLAQQRARDLKRGPRVESGGQSVAICLSCHGRTALADQRIHP